MFGAICFRLVKKEKAGAGDKLKKGDGKKEKKNKKKEMEIVDNC